MILKMDNAILPLSPPNSMPKAIPLFSVKWMMNQFPNTANSWPKYILVLIQIFSTWSAMRTESVMKRAFFKSLKGMKEGIL